MNSERSGHSLQRAAQIAVNCTGRNCLTARDAIEPSALNSWGFGFRSLSSWRRSFPRNVSPQTVITDILVKALLNLGVTHDRTFRRPNYRSESSVNLDSFFQKTAQCRFSLLASSSAYVSILFRAFCEDALNLCPTDRCLSQNPYSGDKESDC